MVCTEKQAEFRVKKGGKIMDFPAFSAAFRQEFGPAFSIC